MAREESVTTKELGIAVIGSGRIGTLRARLAAKHPAVRFVAVSDKDPANAKKHCRVGFEALWRMVA